MIQNHLHAFRISLSSIDSIVITDNIIYALQQLNGVKLKFAFEVICSDITFYFFYLGFYFLFIVCIAYHKNILLILCLRFSVWVRR